MNYRYALLITASILASGCVHPNATEIADEPAVNNTSTPSQLDQSNNTVYLTSSGFQPSEITVGQGGTVTWVNNGSSQMWVGSDSHPSHTEYAGSSLPEHCSGGDQVEAAFDQCSSGDRFSFTFEKTGEWGYHNHLDSSQIGTVTVE